MRSTLLIINQVRVTEEFAQPGDTGDEAMEGQVRLSANKALRKELDYFAVTRHSWQTKRTSRGANAAAVCVLGYVLLLLGVPLHTDGF